MHAARLAADRPAVAAGRAATLNASPARRDDVDARLSRLVTLDAEDARRARHFRTPREEREMLMMLRPVSTERAFALFGLLLGTLPPAAINVRVFGDWLGREPGWTNLGVAAMCLTMNFLCAYVGRQMGATVGQTLLAKAVRSSWIRMLSLTMLAAFVWGVATGAAGGGTFFGLGAIPGAVCALAVALPCFVAFTTLHRLLARGGMIDARHLRPLAWGVSATAAALVLGL
jgi:hypothetical protein